MTDVRPRPMMSGRSRERAVLLALVAAAIVLRALLVARSPTPFGYVWDFYHDGIRVLFDQGRLPVAEDCWTCTNPPLFYLAGWPFYALGRWISTGPTDDVALRLLGGLALISAAVTVVYGVK